MIKERDKIILSPVQRFIAKESSAGVILIIATVIALILANSPLKEYYHFLWNKVYLSFRFNDFELSKPLYYWINDGLMAIFFFVIGLEIKRESNFGELSKPGQSVLPVISAIGGMVVPALVYFFFNYYNSEGMNGWAIPMATDIAFSLGILALIGKRVPLNLKIFLIALAIVDDLGAVLSIAIFYTDTIKVVYLIIAASVFALMMLLNHLKIRDIWLYGVLAVFGLWLMLLLSGVHATVAGVLAAFTIPTGRKLRTSEFANKAQKEINNFAQVSKVHSKYLLSGPQMESVERIRIFCEEVESPLQKLEHKLHNFSSYFIMPVFALANTGISLSGGIQNFGNTVSLGIIFGLVIGKFAGITLFSFIGIKTGLAKLPKDVSFINIIGIGFLAGIGFTMSLFITELAFNDDAMLNTAKLSILFASLVSGLIGYLILKFYIKK